MPTFLGRCATSVRPTSDFVRVDIEYTRNSVDQRDRVELKLIMFNSRHPRLRLVHALTEVRLTQASPPPKTLEPLPITLVLVTHILRVDRFAADRSRSLAPLGGDTSPAERGGSMAVVYLIVCGARPAENTIKHTTDLVTL